MSKKVKQLTGVTKRNLIKKTSTQIFTAVAIAAIIVSFSLVSLNYLWDLSGHYNRVISAKNEASQVLNQNIENIQPLQDSFVILEAGKVKSDTILDALPSKYDFPALATTVESLVARNDVVLESFAGEDTEIVAIQSATVPMPIEIPFTMSVRGKYDSIQEFIDEMHRTIRPMRVVKIELEGYDDSLEATMRIITHYQPKTALDVETRTVE